MVMMKGNGEVDVLRVRPMIDSVEVQSSMISSAIGTPATKQINSKEWIEFLEKVSKRRQAS